MISNTILSPSEGVVEASFTSSSMLKNKQLQSQVIRFMTSFRGMNDAKLNKNSLAVIQGPCSTGKSVFLKSCLKQFEETLKEEKRLIVHVDFSGYKFLSFEMFLTRFEESLIERISALPLNRIIDGFAGSLSFSYHPQYFVHMLNRVFERLDIDSDEVEASDDPDDENDDLDSPTDNSDTRESGRPNPRDQTSSEEATIHSALKRILAFCQKSSQDEKAVKLGFLRLLREVGIEKENFEEKRGVKESLRRTGVDVMDLFFDFLNYTAGYHPKHNFEEHQQDLDRFVDVLLIIGRPLILTILQKTLTFFKPTKKPI